MYYAKYYCGGEITPEDLGGKIKKGENCITKGKRS